MNGLIERLSRMLAEVEEILVVLQQEYDAACSAKAEADGLHRRAQAAAARAIEEFQRAENERDEQLHKISQELDDIDKEMSTLRGKAS